MQPLPVHEASQVGTVRRAATALAGRLGFDEVDTARVALVATEMATNLAKHGREGVVLLRAAARAPAASLELIALDGGPGIAGSPLQTDKVAAHASHRAPIAAVATGTSRHLRYPP